MARQMVYSCAFVLAWGTGTPLPHGERGKTAN